MKRLKIFLLLILMLCSTAHGAISYYHVTATGALGKDGSDWANAMGEAEFETALEAASADDWYYVKEGTYTADSDMNAEAVDGASATPIVVIGVVSGTTNEGAAIVPADWATGANRPLFDMDGSSYVFSVGNFWRLQNLIFKTDDEEGIEGQASSGFVRCDAEVTANANEGFKISTNSFLISCVVTDSGGTNAIGYSLSSSGARMRNCRAEGVATGILVGGNSASISDCIIDSSTKGMDFVSTDGATVTGNTLYNCGTGFTATNANTNIFLDNLLVGCTTEANWTSTFQGSNYADYNSWDASPTTTNFTQGPNKVETNTTLTGPTDNPDDFTLAAGDTHNEDVGLQFDSDMGVAGDYNKNIGVDETDISASGLTVRTAGALLGGVLQGT